ncbi:hypothetical protein KH5_20100 [Urechidicola sp. KH5]
MNTFTNKSTLTRKIISILFFVLFTWSAIIQLNDPDPYHWFTIYLIVALIPIITLFKQLSKKLIWILIGMLLAYSLYHFYYFIDWMGTDQKEEIFGEMVYEKPYLEGTREFLGLFICALSLLYQLPISKK